MSKEIIFKVVSDDNSRITQLKNNEIDLIEDVSAEAIDDLKKLDYIKIVTREGRDYDYIGWSNIDTKLYSSSQALNPNKFFGSSNVRKALSYAINREEILKENLHGYGQLSFGSVSPIFKSYYNNRLEPYEFNPTKAKQMLTKEGWIDRDQNGILEKNNLDFSFKLYIASGNPRRMYAATIVKNNLKAVGIDVTVETMEMGSFINRLFEHELDAFMAGWTVAIPIDLQPYWHSDFERSPFNLVGYSNPEVDSILNELENETKQRTKIALYKKIQELLHQDEPVTFLYWLNVITAYNKRITNITINPLGAIQLCWEWRIND
jgi:peptide/nickel transport system substrate-binding protein